MAAQPTASDDGALSWFRDGAEAFTAVVDAIRPDQWELPGLGEWSVRDLTGHTSRALLTVRSYLRPDEPSDSPELAGPVGYYRAVRDSGASPAAVAERGRQAGRALGPDPAATVTSMARDVSALLETVSGESIIASPFGTIRLRDYLPTRAFELTVHTLDLTRSTGAEPPPALTRRIPAALRFAVDLGVAQGSGEALLLALTGRTPLIPGFSFV